MIECVDKPDKDSEEEFVNDIMMLMASFSGKLYGRRSAKNRRKENGEGNTKTQLCEIHHC